MCIFLVTEGFVHSPSPMFNMRRIMTSSTSGSSSMKKFASTIGRETDQIHKKDLEPIDLRQQIPPNQRLIDINDGDFDRVLDSDGLSVVIFSSSWCGPCKSMETNLVDVSMGHSMIAKFYRIDTDYNPDAAADFQVRSIPSTLFFRGGRLVSEIVGTVPSSVVVSQLVKHNVVAPVSSM